MPFAQLICLASAIVVMLLLSACSKGADPETVAHQFVRFYFVEDNLAEAVKLASGSARVKLEGSLREIETAGVKEPAKDKPVVEVALQETQNISPEEMLYVFSVQSDSAVRSMEPITARLWLSKEGNTWSVSKFVQEE